MCVCECVGVCECVYVCHQKPNLKWAPSGSVTDAIGSPVAYRKHMNEQVHRYGRNVLVNLINHTGSEGRMEQAFAQQVRPSHMHALYVQMHTFIVCMHVCIYCMYVCVYLCMYVCMYVCTYVRMYVCMYVCMYCIKLSCMFCNRVYVCVYA